MVVPLPSGAAMRFEPHRILLQGRLVDAVCNMADALQVRVETTIREIFRFRFFRRN